MRFDHYVFLFVFSLLSIWQGTTYAEETKKPLVLVIDSYHADYGWTKLYRSGIQSSLSKCCDIAYFEMDTKRRSFSEIPQRAALALEKFKTLNPSAVILADDNAVEQLGYRLGKTGMPIAYLGVSGNPRKYFPKISSNVSGVITGIPYRRNISLIRRYMNKESLKVLVLIENSVTGEIVFNSKFEGATILQISTVSVEVATVSTEHEWKEKIQNAKENGFDAILPILYHSLHDNKGKAISSESILSWSSHNSPVPIFGISKRSILRENGTIGGLVSTGGSHGEKAAELIKKMIFENEKNLPFSVIPDGAFLFSQYQLKKWNIKLPEQILSQATLLP